MQLKQDNCTNLRVNLLPPRKKLYTATLSRVFLDRFLDSGPVLQICPEDLFKYLDTDFTRLESSNRATCA